MSQLSADTTSDLFDAINTRLSHMPAVAEYKVSNDLPIEDLPREAIVLRETMLAATAAGLQPDSVADFFQAQIDMARTIQNRHRTTLLAGTDPAGNPDLENTIRPALDALGVLITQLLAQRIAEDGHLQESEWTAFSNSITAPYLEAAEKRRLFASLLRVRAR